MDVWMCFFFLNWNLGGAPLFRFYAYCSVVIVVVTFIVLLNNKIHELC